MLQRAASVLAVALLAGCSTSTADPAETSSERLTLVFSHLSVAQTDSTITIAYATPGPLLAVTLGGKTQTATALTTGAVQNQSVVFTGLAPCTSYVWSIPAYPTTVAGQTNTHWTGDTACAATETRTADVSWQFAGAEHQEQQNFGCGGWSSDWPIGYGWSSQIAKLGQPDGYFTGGQTGFQHFSNGSSFCAESTVHVWRSELQYDLPDLDWARGVTGAYLTARYITSSNTGEEVCMPYVSSLEEQPWPAQQGVAWQYVLPPRESDYAIQLSPSAPQDGSERYSAKNGVLTVSYPIPGQRLIAGFAELNDGFIDLADNANPTWATDNRYCRTTISGAAMTYMFRPLPPETPLCSASINCTTATITCTPTPEVVQFTASGNRLVGSSDGTGGAAPSITDGSSAVGDTYTACSTNALGATACGAVQLISEAACPPPPPPPPPPSGSGSHSCGVGYYWDGTRCAKDFCACGGVYPKCTVCQ